MPYSTCAVYNKYGSEMYENALQIWKLGKLLLADLRLNFAINTPNFTFLTTYFTATIGFVYLT